MTERHRTDPAERPANAYLVGIVLGRYLERQIMRWWLLRLRQKLALGIKELDAAASEAADAMDRLGAALDDLGAEEAELFDGIAGHD